MCGSIEAIEVHNGAIMPLSEWWIVKEMLYRE
jgi:hypothetical protein